MSAALFEKGLPRKAEIAYDDGRGAQPEANPICIDRWQKEGMVTKKGEPWGILVPIAVRMRCKVRWSKVAAWPCKVSEYRLSLANAFTPCKASEYRLSPASPLGRCSGSEYRLSPPKPFSPRRLGMSWTSANAPVVD